MSSFPAGGSVTALLELRKYFSGSFHIAIATGQKEKNPRRKPKHGHDHTIDREIKNFISPRGKDTVVRNPACYMPFVSQLSWCSGTHSSITHTRCKILCAFKQPLAFVHASISFKNITWANQISVRKDDMIWGLFLGLDYIQQHGANSSPCSVCVWDYIYLLLVNTKGVPFGKFRTLASACSPPSLAASSLPPEPEKGQ